MELLNYVLMWCYFTGILEVDQGKAEVYYVYMPGWNSAIINDWILSENIWLWHETTGWGQINPRSSYNVVIVYGYFGVDRRQSWAILSISEWNITTSSWREIVWDYFIIARGRRPCTNNKILSGSYSIMC